MKKIISVLIILALAFSMFSCKKKVDTEDEVANTIQDEIPATETEKVTETEKEAEDTDKTENKPSQSVNSQTNPPEPEQVPQTPVTNENPERSLLEDIEFADSKRAEGFTLPFEKSRCYYVLSSKMDADVFINKNLDKFSDNFEYEYHFINVTKDYDNKFFEKNSLLVIPYVEASSIYSHKISPLKENGDFFELDIYRIYANFLTGDEARYFFVVPFDKSLDITDDSKININVYEYSTEYNTLKSETNYQLVNESEHSLLGDIEFEDFKRAKVYTLSSERLKNPWVLSSKKDMDAFIDKNSGELGNDHEHHFANVTKEYGDEFFEKNSILVIPYVAGSIVYSHEITPIKANADSFELDIYEIYSNSTLDMAAEYLFVLPFNKSLDISKGSKIKLNIYRYSTTFNKIDHTSETEVTVGE